MLDGSCKLYLLKPWDNYLLKMLLQQLLSVREILHDRRLLTFINKIDGLCTMPDTYSRLTELIERDAEMKEIAVAIERDPIMVAKVLQMANSAFFGVRTGSVEQAIKYLGLGVVKTIVLTASLCELLPERGGVLGKDLLWRHAVVTNHLICRTYSRLTGKQLPHTASAVGLLHHIGRLAMVHHTPEGYDKIAAILQDQPELPFDQLEQDIIGVAHQELGGYLLDWWDLPQQIVECALFHHNPGHGSVMDKELAAVVHLASNYALRTIAPTIFEPLDEQAFALLRTSREIWDKLIRDEELDNPAFA